MVSLRGALKSLSDIFSYRYSLAHKKESTLKNKTYFSKKVTSLFEMTIFRPLRGLK